LITHCSILSVSLGSLYSSANSTDFSPGGKNLITGKDLTPNLSAIYFYSVASTLPTLT